MAPLSKGDIALATIADQGMQETLAIISRLVRKKNPACIPGIAHHTRTGKAAASSKGVSANRQASLVQVRPRLAKTTGEPAKRHRQASRHTPQDHIEPGMAKHGKPSIAEPQSADSQHVANRGWAQEPTERPHLSKYRQEVI